MNSFDTPEHLKKALDLISDDHGDERLRPLKTIEETVDEIEISEARFKGLAKKRGLPMTREEYEERRTKKRAL